MKHSYQSARLPTTVLLLLLLLLPVGGVVVVLLLLLPMSMMGLAIVLILRLAT